MASFDILNPQRLPQLSTNPSREELKLFTNYGVKELRCFTNQFEGILVNYDSCEEEWSSFRQFLNDPSNKRKSHEAVIDELCTNPTSSRVFPTMSAMASICRVVPVHTSDVEQTFSQLKLAKTRIRNRMKEKTRFFASDHPRRSRLKGFSIRRSYRTLGQKEKTPHFFAPSLNIARLFFTIFQSEFAAVQREIHKEMPRP